ncbi:MAG TPA: Rieske (2Fe-2S) protein [Polyangiales bacterium]|nr:Rieske (2Fe-2S) protein [Polyangiales bacterium]
MSSPPGLRQRVYVGTMAELTSQRWLLAHLAPDAFGRPREAIVLLDESDEPRAYLNQCRHLPIPLDAGSRDFFFKGELQCSTHGARYRLRDGMCVAGPCRGAALAALPIEITTALVFVVDNGAR